MTCVARLLLVVALLVVGSCGDWPWRRDMVTPPSRSIAATARPAPEGTMAWSPPTGSIQQLSAAPSLEAGQSLYGSYCSPCHGFSGAGDGSVAAYFQPMRDLTDPTVRSRSDQDLFDIVSNGVGRMPASRHELTPDERWLVIGYLREMEAAR